MSFKDRLMLSMLRLIIRLEGWVEVKPRSWRHGSGWLTGDGSELVRLIMRRLCARERIIRDKKHDKQTKSKPHT